MQTFPLHTGWGGVGGGGFGGEGVLKDFQEPAFFVVVEKTCFRFLFKTAYFCKNKTLSVNNWTKVGTGTEG